MGYGKKIDLINRNSGKKSPNKGTVAFMTYTLSDEKLEELSELAEKLKKAGVSLSITRYETTESESGYDIMQFQVDEEQFLSVTTRHAGRKPDFSAKYDKYKKCTVQQLREKLQTMSKTKIAEELGCPRMTLYRIIKNIEKMEPDETMSIWHFTTGL